MISLDSLPHLPGCYLFKDSRDQVIYVGKARDLKKRVSSYFQKQDHGPRTAALVAAAKGLDFIVTNTEVEALLLENTLVMKLPIAAELGPERRPSGTCSKCGPES